MLSRAWHQEAGLTQQALDTNQQLPLASAPWWLWNLGRPMSDEDWFSRYISTLKTRTEMVLEMLVFSLLNQLMRLVTWNILLYNVTVKPASLTSRHFYVIKCNIITFVIFNEVIFSFLDTVSAAVIILSHIKYIEDLKIMRWRRTKEKVCHCLWKY
jgi:hypothetical protein